MGEKKYVFLTILGGLILGAAALFFLWRLPVSQLEEGGEPEFASLPAGGRSEQLRKPDFFEKFGSAEVQTNQHSFSNFFREGTGDASTIFNEPSSDFLFEPLPARQGSSKPGSSVLLPETKRVTITEEKKVDILYGSNYLQFLAIMQELMVEDGFMPQDARYNFKSDREIKNFLVNFNNWLFKKELITQEEWHDAQKSLFKVLPVIQQTDLKSRENDFFRQGLRFFRRALAQKSTTTPAVSLASAVGPLAIGSILLSAFDGFGISDLLGGFSAPDAFTDIAGPGTSVQDVLDLEFGSTLGSFAPDAFTDIAGPGSSPLDILDAEFGAQLLEPEGFVQAFEGVADIASFVGGFFGGKECWRSGGPPVIPGRNVPVPWCKAGLRICSKGLCFTSNCPGPFGEGCVVGLGCINYNSVICPGVAGTIGAIWDPQTKICGCGI